MPLGLPCASLGWETTLSPCGEHAHADGGLHFFCLFSLSPHRLKFLEKCQYHSHRMARKRTHCRRCPEGQCRPWAPHLAVCSSLGPHLHLLPSLRVLCLERTPIFRFMAHQLGAQSRSRRGAPPYPSCGSWGPPALGSAASSRDPTPQRLQRARALLVASLGAVSGLALRPSTDPTQPPRPAGPPSGE